MKEVFISHVEEDGDIAGALATDLKARGFEAWYYERDGVRGVDLLDQITEAIVGSKAVVVILSGQSLNDMRWVETEIKSAWGRRKNLIPLLRGVSPDELAEKAPSLCTAFGNPLYISISESDVPAAVSSVAGVLAHHGIKPGPETGRAARVPATETPTEIAQRGHSKRKPGQHERDSGRPLKADAYFEGGISESMGLAGALQAVTQSGYSLQQVAGASAGAVVASLLAAGYASVEIKEVLDSFDLGRFKRTSRKTGRSTHGTDPMEVGICDGERFQQWLESLLQAKGKVRFGDVRTPWSEPRYAYHLQVIASDLTRGKMLVLPQDAAEYGLDPDNLSIALAVRMSANVPGVFEPVRLEASGGSKCYIVDGTVLSNYLVWLLDDGTSNPPWPTFGFKIVVPFTRTLSPAGKPVTMTLALVDALMQARGATYVSDSKGDYMRSITIPGGDVRATDLKVSSEQSQRFYQEGHMAARRFLDRWDFDNWKKKYR